MFFEPKEVSRIFKNFYENLAQSLVDKLPASPNKFNNETTKMYYDNLGISGELKFSEVDPIQICDFLRKTNISKAPGIDKLSGIFIRDGAEILAAPLSQIVNLSILSSTFPDLGKISKLKALFKKGSKVDPKNYRPISLLPLLSKVFETVIHLQTAKFLEDNAILFMHQSGFRPKHSTESCLTHLCDRILEGCDSGYHPDRPPESL